MPVIPTLIPISELRQRQSDVLNNLSKEEVVLTQHGRGVAVLVGIKQWGQLMTELEDLRDAVEATKVRLKAHETVPFAEYEEGR